MELIEFEERPAPRLRKVELELVEAERLLRRVLANLELLLAAGWVHGRLSPDEILYRPGRLTLLGFAEAVEARSHLGARELLERDVDRVVGYFEEAGARCSPREVLRGLWDRHVGDPEGRAGSTDRATRCAAGGGAAGTRLARPAPS